MPLVGYKRILSYGEDGDGTRSEYVPVFPRNPRAGRQNSLAKEDIRQLEEWMDTHGFGEILCHGAYTMNGASTKEEVREFARTAIREDLAKVSLLPRCLYNFHPGAHLETGDGCCHSSHCGYGELCYGSGRPEYYRAFETMAGKGTEVGRTFEELAEIISRVERKDHVGVCLDTCHVYDGGYDIVNDLDGVLKRFDQIVGLEKLKAVHLNDDKNPLGSHKDRHEKIGEGTIGTEAFARIINHPALRELPFFWKHLTNFRDIKRKLLCCVLFGRRNKMNERIKIKK